jgi:hypothetical protein
VVRRWLLRGGSSSVQRRRSHSLVSVGVANNNSLVGVIMNRLAFALVALSSSILLVNGQEDLRNFLGKCVGQGTNLDSCLLQLADKLKPYMKTGIPLLNIPKTDPMDIDKISFQLKNPLGVVTVKFTENMVEGLSTHTINSIRANKAAKTLSMEIFVPKATARGRYHMQGVLGPLELDESLAPAPYTTSFTGTTVSGVAKMDVVNGKLEIVQNPDVTINVEGLNVQMENLFGGEADGLAKVVLRFVNKESDKFIKDFQPEIAKQVSQLIKTFFNSALDNIPVSTFE